MPWYGQSFARPAASLSCTACHMNWPSDSRKAMRTPLSPLTFGSRGPSLFVPTKIMPPATTGFPYACEPSSATHLTFFFVLTSQVVGRPFMLDTMLRSGVPPHIGQSPEPGSDVAKMKEPASTNPLITNKYFFIVVSAFLTARGAPPPLALARRPRASLGPQALLTARGAPHFSMRLGPHPHALPPRALRSAAAEGSRALSLGGFAPRSGRRRQSLV